MEHSHRYFNNEKCMFFPCHSLPDNGEFNCLFCYCPLYPLGDDCDGIYKWVEHENIKIKLCMDCHLPHIPEHYDMIMDKLTEENLTAILTKSKDGA